jgi:hypothetical protein
MPWYEFQPLPLRNDAEWPRRTIPTSEEFSGGKPSPLPQKLIGRVYFELRHGLSWSEAEAVAKELNKAIATMCVRHLAAGE